MNRPAQVIKTVIFYLLEVVSVQSSCLRSSCRFSYKEIHMACSAIHTHQGDCSNHRRQLEKIIILIHDGHDQIGFLCDYAGKVLCGKLDREGCV